MVFSALIGAEVKRKEDPHLLTGRGTFTANLKLPGMKYVAFVRSVFAHANIKGIDVEDARQRDGVVAVLTGEDLQDALKKIYPVLPPDENPTRRTFPLTVGRARYVGEPIAVVIADTPEIAEDALEDIFVDYEPLPAVATLEQADADDAPLVWDDAPGNVEHVFGKQHGDVDAAFANAHAVVKARLYQQRLAGAPMEPRAVAAAPDIATGGLTIWTATQTPHGVRSDISKTLGIADNLIRVIASDVGGGFGVKSGSYPEEHVLAALVQRFGIPLRWVETRSENLQATIQGRSQIADVEAAADEDGRITAVRMRILADTGAYPNATVLPNLTVMMSTGVYDIPNVDVEVKILFTNAVPIAPYRGAGRPEATYYIERLVDLVAHELDLDPVAVRRKNFIAPDAFPFKSPLGPMYDSGEYEKALNRLLEIADYEALRKEQSTRRENDDDRLLGIGVSSYVEMSGMGPFESATVRVNPSGAVTVYSGLMPQGQGNATAFAQIVADELGVDFDQVEVKFGDTASVAMGIGTFASRGLTVGGTAMIYAARQVRDKALKFAANMLEAAPEDVEYKEGKYQVKGVPDRALTLAEIAHQAHFGELPPDTTPGLEVTEFHRPPGIIFPFGAHLAVVEVERDTGIIHLRDYYAVDDCGVRINPMIVEGQIHGGIVQGIGQALMEIAAYDEAGQLVSGTFMDYHIPRAGDFSHFTTDATETPTPHSPLGAKGIGEAATIGATPAVVNAVMDALKPFGVRHIDMPLWPVKVWQAMQSTD